ncbi:hypothetical protein [Actinokineospora cianjurensis]|uniref:Uncharacterized protein n=1 Tax=Actinokineospora cianjurensis TaxID=585224 RepID=A0A421BDD5_9PSEU|nr:hypothetical protein [Actinokineospora cianjurensis]RLK62357.1 hypothetical protein CLV68_2914 [Actinokineospora cianjurensis]
MAQVRTEVPTAAAHVWNVIADGWIYATWVVGALLVPRNRETLSRLSDLAAKP